MSNAANSSNKPGTALITGASTGIGATYADRLARRGYDLVLVARDAQRLEQVAERLRKETSAKIEILAAAVAPGFIQRKGGTLINLASVLALAPEMFNGAYSGTKAFVLNLTQSLQNELGKHGVRVQAVLPGATRTEIWERSGSDINALPDAMVMSVDDLV